MSFFCNPCSLGLIDRGWGGSAVLHKTRRKTVPQLCPEKEDKRTMLIIDYLHPGYSCCQGRPCNLVSFNDFKMVLPELKTSTVLLPEWHQFQRLFFSDFLNHFHYSTCTTAPCSLHDIIPLKTFMAQFSDQSLSEEGQNQLTPHWEMTCTTSLNRPIRYCIYRTVQHCMLSLRLTTLLLI